MSSSALVPTSQSRTLLKIVLAGAKGVGKTSLMKKYVFNKFPSEYKASLGADYVSKNIEIGNAPVTLMIWDTAGTEEFDPELVEFYRGISCCIFVCDVYIGRSFDVFDAWYTDFLIQVCPPGFPKIPVVVVGNKVDIDDGGTRDIFRQPAAEWCAQRGNIPYFEASVRQHYNVDAVFLCAAQLAMGNPDSHIIV